MPEVDAIVGNPPIRVDKIQQELGRAHVNAIRSRFPGIDAGRYCVYWFRRAHDHLKPGQRADSSVRTQSAKTTPALGS